MQKLSATSKKLKFVLIVAECNVNSKYNFRRNRVITF